MRIPVKWKKKALLIQYGLATQQDLLDQTKRFISAQDALDYCMLDGSIYIVKLVPIEWRPKLQNFIILDDNSKKQFCHEIQQYHNYNEIWCCKNEAKKGIPIYGRFSIDQSSQTIELVQGKTARLIEKIPGVDKYVFASRNAWGWHYDVVQKGDLDFREIAYRIEREREKIIIFLNDLNKIGIWSISFEFRFVGSEFFFIDWDTADDVLVVNHLWDERT